MGGAAGYQGHGAEFFLCMLPFHQTIHGLSAKFTRRGTIQMSLVVK